MGESEKTESARGGLRNSNAEDVLRLKEVVLSLSVTVSQVLQKTLTGGQVVLGIATEIDLNDAGVKPKPHVSVRRSAAQLGALYPQIKFSTRRPPMSALTIEPTVRK